MKSQTLIIFSKTFMDPSDGSLRACKNPKMHPSTNGTETHSFKMVKKSFSGFWCNAKNALYISLRPSRFFSIIPLLYYSPQISKLQIFFTYSKEREIYFSLESSRSGLQIDWNGILLPKLFWPTVRKNCSSDWEKLLKFEAEGQKF